MFKAISIRPDATLLTRTSDLTGQTHSMELPVPATHLVTWMEDPRSPLLQNAFPALNADQCEFIKTGITPEEWEALIGNEENE